MQTTIPYEARCQVESRIGRDENLLPSQLQFVPDFNDDNLQSVLQLLPLVLDFLKVYKLICTLSLPTFEAKNDDKMSLYSQTMTHDSALMM